MLRGRGRERGTRGRQPTPATSTALGAAGTGLRGRGRRTMKDERCARCAGGEVTEAGERKEANREEVGAPRSRCLRRATARLACVRADRQHTGSSEEGYGTRQSRCACPNALRRSRLPSRTRLDSLAPPPARARQGCIARLVAQDRQGRRLLEVEPVPARERAVPQLEQLDARLARLDLAREGNPVPAVGSRQRRRGRREEGEGRKGGSESALFVLVSTT